MNRKLFKALLVGVCFLTIVGGKAEAAPQKMVGIAIPETHVERWKGDALQMKKELEDKGYKVEIAYADADQTKQNQQIDGFITNGAEAIIVGSVNEAAAQAVSVAKEEGIPVFAYDRLITGSDDFDYYLTFDNYKVGNLQGKAVESALGLDKGEKGKNIVLFSGSPTDNNAKYFFDGAIDVLKSYIESGALTVIGPKPLSSNDPTWTQITTENWQPNIAKTRMESLLAGVAKDVKLDAVLAPNDTIGRAIIEALGSDSKYDKKLPIVTGQDAELLSAKWIVERKQNMTVFKDTRNLAKATAEVVDQVLRGKKVNPSVVHVVDTKTYNKDNKNLTTFLLAPVEVNSKNINQILVESGFYAKEQLKNGK